MDEGSKRSCEEDLVLHGGGGGGVCCQCRLSINAQILLLKVEYKAGKVVGRASAGGSGGR